MRISKRIRINISRSITVRRHRSVRRSIQRIIRKRLRKNSRSRSIITK